MWDLERSQSWRQILCSKKASGSWSLKILAAETFSNDDVSSDSHLEPRD